MHYLLALALVLCSFGSAAQNELILGIHTDEPAPTIGALLAAAGPDGYSIRVQPFSSVDKLREELRTGRIHLALIEETRYEEAGVTVVADIYPSVLHILYKGDTAPGSLGELLRAGPIWAGAPGSIGHEVASELAGDFGVAADELNLLEDAWTIEPDVYFIFGGILARDALSRLGDFRLYSLDDATALMHGSVAEGIALRYPNLRPFILPAQLYPTLSHTPALTLSVATLLVAYEALDEQQVFEMAVAVNEILPRIAAVYPLADVMKLVIEERIDANSALLAFLSLSNQISAEAEAANIALT